MCRHTPLPSDLALSLSDNELEDILRYRCAYLAPDPYTGTPYPRGSMHLEKIWEGPSVDDVMTKVRDQQKLFRNLEQTTFYLENLLEPSKASLRTIPKEERDQFDYELLQSLRQTPKDAEVQEAIQRLQCIPSLQSWGPDIVYKAFDDLDLVLFGGVLRGCTTLRWTDSETYLENRAGLEPMGTHGTTCDRLISPEAVALPHEEFEYIPQVYYSACARIYLNTTTHFLEPIQGSDRSRWDEMWGTLLHEMAHAYLHVTINPHYRRFEWTDPQRIHGRHFQRCLKAINARAEELGLEIGGLFTGEWAEQVDGCWIDDYGMAWPYDSEGEEEEDSVGDGDFPPLTAATTPSLVATHAPCLEQASEFNVANRVVPSTNQAAAALDCSLTAPENTVVKCVDVLAKSKLTLADSMHACA
ncbi:hypothetical protein MMC27_006560 [Xylographa pallens]|nr:hypothetical protein [Xylographa pallens]